jgi:hypothetical protein
MNIKDYVALKSASKVSFSKEGNSIFLTEKVFNAATGEALSDYKHEVQLHNYELDKDLQERDKVQAQAQIDALTQIITDIKAL